MTLVNAEEKFARRVASWMVRSTMQKDELMQRLGKFPEEFVRSVGVHVKQIRGIAQPTK